MAKGTVSVIATSQQGDGTALDQGTVKLIDNQIDTTTGTIRLKAVFPNTNLKLWPGQFVNVRLLERTDENALTVPAAALERGPDGMFVYVVQPDSTVIMQPVEVGNDSESFAIITKGLKLGQRVATTNLFRLEPGARVHVLAPAPRNAATVAAAS